METEQIKTHQKGSGIIEVLIMSGVLLVVIQFMMQSFLNFKTFQKHKDIQMSNLFLKDYINSAADCTATRVELDGDCDPGDAVEIFSNSSLEPTLIKKPKKESYTKISGYQIYAECVTCKKCNNDVRIDVKARLVNKNDKPIVHPIYKTSDWISLYEEVNFKCEIY